MTVPTPETWSTWTAIQRRVAGQLMLVMTPWGGLIAALVTCPPVAIGARAIWPTTCETSVNAPGRIVVIGTVLTWTWSARMRVDSGMSAIATTTGPFGLGVPFGWLGLFGLLGFARNRMPTNAMTARKTPTSRTRRFERLK